MRLTEKGTPPTQIFRSMSKSDNDARLCPVLTMTNKTVYIGATIKKQTVEAVTGDFVSFAEKPYYRIANYDRLRPFFMSIVSDSDHWMFLSSDGGLTAGRRNPEHALFPYYTDDKIHDARDLTGSKTLILLEKPDRMILWEPFSAVSRDLYDVQRNIYKSVYGNSIVFEEVNRELSLIFFYSWSNSDAYGFVKRSGLRNLSSSQVQVRVLDGIQNLLPAGVDRSLQTTSSTLVDAYKKSELQPDTGLALFRLSSIPVDRPEPSESLKATTVWSYGLESPTHLLSILQLEQFRQGLPLTEETDVRAERGAYFVNAKLELSPATETDWYIVAELDQAHADVAALEQMLAENVDVRQQLSRDVKQGTERLRALVSRADGVQHTADQLSTTRHFSNVLFNLMRGGVFDNNYVVAAADFQNFVQQHNGPLAQRHSDFLGGLPKSVSLSSLQAGVAKQADPQLERLCYEYLPLMFSRRHGDPSRPWNNFSIELRRDDGKRNLSYQGNWRDIFQNWEALSLSFPSFVEGMICRFVNASTADGYNPYRITRDGFDWEVTDPHDPWSYIGYWGDHQIVYLLKLLEVSHAHHPGVLQTFLTRDIFTYANVPYRIKPYEQLLENSHVTIDYDCEAASSVAQRVEQIGADGKLLCDRDGEVYRVNLTEKLLVSMLAKMTNFIPEAGIWMNTQRPEWNDANNALVGYGVSMVTVYYLRRFLCFAAALFKSLPPQEIELSGEVADLLNAIRDTLNRHQNLLDSALSDMDRKAVLDDLGGAGSAYRTKIYERGFSAKKKRVAKTDLEALFDVVLKFVDHTIRANRRNDNLYHAYNLITLDKRDAISIQHLSEMLEGQVAVLSSETLSTEESLQLLDALRNSALYRPDQQSYLLYPDRRLPRFVEKNQIPVDLVARSPLLKKLVEEGDRHLLAKATGGTYHFNSGFRNSDGVVAALDWLSEHGYHDDVRRDRDYVLEVWEQLFDHRSYTGRSGTFFGYEGLGCIYWHMVSKLLLAVQETYFRMADEEADPSQLAELAARYYEIRSGLGITKNPADYGAFPTDPYSHTPGNAGVQQPGMTGQVKEDIISRWGELGVLVTDGRIRFRPDLLRRSEFSSHPAEFTYYDLGGNQQTIPLDAEQLVFTYCQVPIIYSLSADNNIRMTYCHEKIEEISGLELDRNRSASVFSRAGDVASIEVALLPGLPDMPSSHH